MLLKKCITAMVYFKILQKLHKCGYFYSKNDLTEASYKTDAIENRDSSDGTSIKKLHCQATLRKRKSQIDEKKKYILNYPCSC